MKKLKKEQKRVLKDFIRCPDCGVAYAQGAPHEMFCLAKTCTACEVTYTRVIPPNEDGERICDACVLKEEEDLL